MMQKRMALNPKKIGTRPPVTSPPSPRPGMQSARRRKRRKGKSRLSTPMIAPVMMKTITLVLVDLKDHSLFVPFEA